VNESGSSKWCKQWLENAIRDIQRQKWRDLETVGRGSFKVIENGAV